jgi:hypothetical protein
MDLKRPINGDSTGNYKKECAGDLSGAAISAHGQPPLAPFLARYGALVGIGF